ncbi:unnamed protein product [Leuciscus chuanchicus]
MQTTLPSCTVALEETGARKDQGDVVRLALTGIKCDCWRMRPVLRKTPSSPCSPLCQQVTH